MRNKLNSQTGASMLMAMVYLLVCLTAGTIVLSAAHTNIGRLQQGEIEQQDYLAVASAIRMIQEDVSGRSFTGSYREICSSVYHPPVTDEAGETGSPAWTEEVGPEFETGTCALSEESLVLSDELLKEIYLRKLAPEVLRPAGPDRDELELPLVFSAGGELPPVEGVLGITATDWDPQGRGLFTVTVTLSARRDGEERYVTTLTMPAACAHSTESETQVLGDTTTTVETHRTVVTWGEGRVRKGGAEG